MVQIKPSEEQHIKAVYAFAAEQLRSGVYPRDVQLMLIEKGLDHESARTVVSNLTRLRSEAIRKEAYKNMGYGALWCIGGIVVTLGTYSAASGGGRFMVAWGAILFGGIQFFRGLFQLSER